MGRRLGSLIPLLLTPLFVFLALRHTDWRQFLDGVLHAQPGLIAIGLLLGTTSLALRAMRWRSLLSARADVEYMTVFWAASGGYLANTLLPARAGELVRSTMVARNSGLSQSFLLATTLTERVFDAAALALAALLALLTMGQAPHWMVQASRTVALASGVGVLGIVLLPRLEAQCLRLVGMTPPAIRGRLAGLTEHAVCGVRALHNVKRASTFGLLTPLIWILDVLGTTIVGRALDLPISIGSAFLLLAVLGLSSAIPATPGNVGFSQFVAVSVLEPLGLAHGQALGYVLILQASGVLIFLLWGIPALWLAGKSNGRHLRPARAAGALHANTLENSLE
ncbi:MAG TPA: lysylphosphatidylglycerol synthase transmembrane domain-containing protein [Bryobacteraceae bacterium]|nr:lysylphosphatidylglycerol synthase transmembrane domain-containing protein [Bryobacteraceae bacterium]